MAADRAPLDSAGALRLDYLAAGGVVVYAGQVLVLGRPSRDELRLPKGHVEPGEEIDAAACREVSEESGLQALAVVAGLGFQRVLFRHRGRWMRCGEHWFLMRPVTEPGTSASMARLDLAGRPEADVAQFEPRWMPLKEAERALSFAAERNVLRKAIQHGERGR